MPSMPGMGAMPSMGAMPGMPGMGMMPGMMPGMNPMMMMAMMQQMAAKMGGAMPTAAAAGGAAASAASEKRKDAEPALGLLDDDIDPQVQELCDYFNIEDRWVKRLNETMRKRQETKQEDIDKLYEVLERARSPTGLLTVKIGEMECGRFVGKIKPDKDVERLARKFKLDEPVASRLTELVHRRKQQGEADRAAKDLFTIEQHLRYCKRTSAMATLLAGKLLEGDVDELPDLTEAEQVMEKYKLDEDARSKLREIIEKRSADHKEVLKQVIKHLDTSVNCSSMLCKIARPLIDHEHLPDPPDRPAKGKGKGDKGDKGDDKGDRQKGDRHDRGDRGDRGDRDRRRDRSRDRDRDRRDRSRSRSRRKNDRDD